MPRPMHDEPDHLSSFLEQCGALKLRVVHFVHEDLGDWLDSQMRQVVALSGPLTEGAAVAIVDDLIHRPGVVDGESVLDLFVNATPDLTEEEREIVLGWRESFLGVFKVRAFSSGVFETTNLVDDLDYRLAGTALNAETVKTLTREGFVFTRIERARDLWLMSGSQRPIRDRKTALGMAAKLALNTPALRLRNPKHLAEAREKARTSHEHFLACFGAAWLVGPPSEVERRYNEAASADHSHLPPLQFAADYRSFESVGAFSDPTEGIAVLPDAAPLIRALEDPSALKDGVTRQLVWEFLEMEGSSVMLFRILAEHRPAQLDRMMGKLLRRWFFRWSKDGETLLRERNPGLADREALPRTVPLTDEMLVAWRALHDGEEGLASKPKPKPKPKRRGKRKQENLSRRKNRR